MDIEEAKKMEGTEFIYEFPCGDTIPAYVKKFDPKIGLTCLSLTSETEEGYQPNSSDPALEEDGTFCLIGVNLRNGYHKLQACFNRLKEIKETGRYVCKNFSSGGITTCAFSQ